MLALSSCSVDNLNVPQITEFNYNGVVNILRKCWLPAPFLIGRKTD